MVTLNDFFASRVISAATNPFSYFILFEIDIMQMKTFEKITIKLKNRPITAGGYWDKEINVVLF